MELSLGLVLYIWESLAEIVFKARRLGEITEGINMDRKEEQFLSLGSLQCLNIRDLSHRDWERVAMETGGNQGSVLS